MTDSGQLWNRITGEWVAILRDALARLSAGDHDEVEVDLNRRLYREIVAVQHARAVAGEEQIPVVPEGHNPPASDDEDRAARENKIPDFYWPLIDHYAADPRKAALQFVIECKRLAPTNGSWNFCENYVAHGVLRFREKDHGYGQGAPDGAMVGYLQAIDEEDALAVVNERLRDVGIEELARVEGAAIAEFNHGFDRPFEVTPFALAHIWVRSST